MVRYTSPADINVTKGFEEVLYYVNDVSDNWISNLILIALYVIITFGYYNSRKNVDDNSLFNGMAVAGFITALIAILFWIGGFLDTLPLILTIIIAVVSFFLSFLRR